MFDKLKDLGGLMQQAQQMQQKMKELQDQLERQEIVGSSGAGMVTITVNGKGEEASLLAGLHGGVDDEAPLGEDYPADDDIPESDS